MGLASTHLGTWKTLKLGNSTWAETDEGPRCTVFSWSSSDSSFMYSTTISKTLYTVTFILIGNYYSFVAAGEFSLDRKAAQRLRWDQQ